MSKTFLTGILREELGYQGLIITDDMMMNGATTWAGTLSSAFRQAIEAGNDIIISSTTAQLNEALWTSNLNLMSTSAVFKARVMDAAHRVILSKLEYFKGENPVPLYPKVEEISQHIPDPEAQEFFLAQACRSITLYKGTCFLCQLMLQRLPVREFCWRDKASSQSFFRKASVATQKPTL